MKILFLVYHGFSPSSGISKKIHYQVEGLRQNNHKVYLCYYDFDERGHRCRMVDGKVIKDYGSGKLAALRQRLQYGCVYDYCIDNGIQMVYARCFQNATPWLIRLFSRLRKRGIKSVTEIPTYPYDKEFVGFSFLTRMNLHVDQLFRKSLARQMEAMVTFSDADSIFGQRTIKISNGVDFKSIPVHDRSKIDTSKEIHLIGVAEVHYWHGFDRLIAGLGEYYQQTNDSRKVYFHIVGGVWITEMYDSIHAPGFHELMEKYGIQDKVIFHDQLFGDELDMVFNQCAFAIGSLARHRSGISNIKTLKNREYAARGIPFIYSETDTDFDDKPYVIKAPADESPIDINTIIAFIDNSSIDAHTIRDSVKHLSWANQMQSVVEQINF